MPDAFPDHDDAFWEDLAQRNWRRVRWRRSSGSEEIPVCAVRGTPIHREGTYYVRPAYADGELWLSQQGYDELKLRTSGRRATRKARPDQG